MSNQLLIPKIKEYAFRLGFDLCKVISVGEPRYAKEFNDWIELNYYADMEYIARAQKIRLNPNELLPKPKSVIVLGKKYGHKKLPKNINQHREYKNFGIIANYALGIEKEEAGINHKTKIARDYHKDILPKLILIDKFVANKTLRTTPAKAWVDSGPVLERDFAEQAGLGFIGKNTCLINQQLGSGIFLASIWLPEEFPEVEYDRRTKFERKKHINIIINNNENSSQGQSIGSCGNCRRCLDLCPTKAIVKPYQLNANLCIAYWTIEAKIAPPPALARLFGNRIFGCDICQEVCPWNMRLEKNNVIEENINQININDYLFPNGQLLPLTEGFQKATPYWLDDGAFLEKFAGTAIMRAGRVLMKRNVENAIINIGKDV